MTFDPNGAYEVELMGCVSAEEGQLLADEFLSKFIAFVEANGWYFGGGVRQIIDGYYVDEKLNAIAPIDNN